MFIEESALEVQAYEDLLRDHDQAERDPYSNQTDLCASVYAVAKELGVTLDRRFSRGCLAGLTYCIVSPVGMVRPCAYMTEEAGSIREKPFDEIWVKVNCLRVCVPAEYGGSCGK